MVLITSEELLSRFSAFLAEETGLYFPRKRWPDLNDRLGKAAGEFQFEDIESWLERFLETPRGTKVETILSEHFTVGETYFFREEETLKLFQERILPELIRARVGGEQRLNIWSAGCCTGEEVYTLAILLNRALPDFKSWNITLLGTDLNRRFLEKGLKGVYGDWSFRNAPEGFRENYFRRISPDSFEILPRFKKMVDFSCLNLAAEDYQSIRKQFGRMDVIFCRNVLMYLTPDCQRKVVDRFYQIMEAGGWLAVSPAETSPALFNRFSNVGIGNAILYRKSSTK